MVECVKKHFITIVALIIIIVAIIVTVVVVKNLSDDDKKEGREGGGGGGGERRGDGNVETLTIIKNNNQFQKPNVKLNAEFELVKMGNGMTGMLISDPYASQFHIQFTMKYGAFIDTISGISHFGEHMVLQSSKKYNSLYPVFNKFFGIKGAALDATTGGTMQSYFIYLPFNILYEEAMDILTESFRYTLYSPELIKNEIQAVNHEFYLRMDSAKEGEIVRQLSSNKTSFNGMSCGNNETLKPSESELLSKKLKGYHMVVKSPDKIFFTLYSNKTLDEEREIAKKYLNYEMHIFPDCEIDIDDKKKLEENIKNIENIEIFDNNLYKHGIYFNTNTNINILVIYYYIGNIKTQEIKFNIFEYFNYLFNCESLNKILRDKNYIAMYSGVETSGDFTLDNNTVFAVQMILTEDGLKNINDVLLIINKYINIMKKEGCKQKYFDDFIKYMNNKDILKFNKKNTISFKSYMNIFEKYHHFENGNIFLSGKYLYDYELLSELLNLIRYEKSFYTINVKENITNLNLDGIINEKEINNLKYYNSDFIIGAIPDELETNITDNSITIENLTIRNTSTYFSANYNDPVIPCYKEIENKCKEKNEFDVNKDDKYNGTILDENDKNYVTIYQIDKSSESHLVYSNLEFKINLQIVPNIQEILSVEKAYIYYSLSEIMEIQETVNIDFDQNKKLLNIIFKTFSDNTEIIINRFIDILKETPTEENFKYSILLVISDLDQSKSISFNSYIDNILQQILSNETADDINETINSINNITYEQFKQCHEIFLNGINKINFKIAGNIDKELVERIHNHIKSTIEIHNIMLFTQIYLEDNNVPFVKNYYKKSTINVPENGIVVVYPFPKELLLYFQVFAACFWQIALNYLRFNYTNAYTPHVEVYNDAFIIFEQGLFKEVDKMEDDINKVLYDTIVNKTIEPLNFKEIIESYISKEKAKEEKTLDNLFGDFIKGKSLNTVNVNDLKNITNFSGLIDQISDYFINPRRYTILVGRKDLSDENFNGMFERRSKIEKYSLNENITIEHLKI